GGGGGGGWGGGDGGRRGGGGGGGRRRVHGGGGGAPPPPVNGSRTEKSHVDVPGPPRQRRPARPALRLRGLRIRVRGPELHAGKAGPSAARVPHRRPGRAVPRQWT